MDIRLLRKGSSGMAGTHANVDHHARKIKALVMFLEDCIPHMPFKAWIQGNNVHVLETKDDRKFALRPIHTKGGYNGISLWAQVSRSQKVFLSAVYFDEDITSWYAFLTLLGGLTKIPPIEVHQTNKAAVQEDAG